LLASEAALLYRRGDLSTAKTRLVESLEIGTDHSSASMQRAVYGTAVAVLTGDEELLERCHDQARAKSDDQVGFVAFSYAERLAAGRTIEAAELLHRAVPSVGCGNHAPFELAIAIARWGTLEDAERARAQFERFADPASRPLREACLTLIDAYVAARTGRPEVKALGLVAAAAFSALGLPLWEADGLRLGGETDRAMAIYERIGAVARRWELERRMAIAPEAGEAESLLTGREREVAELVASGLSNAEIAAKLFVTVKAVEKHLGSIYKKLHFSSRSKLIVYMKAG
jgi:DNA-binding CsgD family transcriptional regulator